VQRGVTAGILAELSRCSGHVEYVVCDLKRQAESCTETTERVHSRRTGFRSDPTDPSCGTEQRTRLGAVETIKLV
jgi:hypothetical protein